MVKYYWVCAIAMILVGGFEWGLGQKMFKPTLFIVGTLSVLGFIMLAFYAWFLPVSSATWLVWLIGSVGLILGLIVGFFLTKMVRIGVAALAAWGGVVIALLIHEAFMYHIHSQAVFWVMICGFGAVFALTTLWKYKWVLIFSTSFLGSYLVVRGASLFIGGYPNEFTMINEIKEHGGIEGKHWPVYLYIVAIGLMTVGGVILQFRIKKKGTTGDKYDYYTRV
jgi:hypothetical protein